MASLKSLLIIAVPFKEWELDSVTGERLLNGPNS